MSENLVVFYSRRGQNYVSGSIRNLEKGNAEFISEYIKKAVGADVFEIETVKPYPEDYMQCTEAAKKELRDNSRPELKKYLKDVSIYENIFIVGPCWWGTYPMPVFSLLEKTDFKGKKLFPVMTHEGSGAGSCEKDLKKICKGAIINKCLAVKGSDVPDSEKAVFAWAGKCIS